MESRTPKPNGPKKSKRQVRVFFVFKRQTAASQKDKPKYFCKSVRHTERQLFSLKNKTKKKKLHTQNTHAQVNFFKLCFDVLWFDGLTSRTEEKQQQQKSCLFERSCRSRTKRICFFFVVVCVVVFSGWLICFPFDGGGARKCDTQPNPPNFFFKVLWINFVCFFLSSSSSLGRWTIENLCSGFFFVFLFG